MRKILLLSSISIFSLAHLQVNAQALFTTMDSIDINNINASVLVHGDMWWNPVTGTAHCYFPANSAKTIDFAGAIWMSGYDGAGQLHIAAQTYRQSGNDYWPGPLDATGTLTYATSYNWAKIWKVNLTDIQSFQSLTTHTISNTPAMILTWPAKGNANAQGNGGATLAIADDMAPFVDLNGNGIYEPLLGEYPAIKGDQALWWVFSDNGPTHTQTNGNPLGVEIHAMAYGYSRGTLIDNVVYYEYTIVNKSANNYNNFRIAQWNDPAIGYYGPNFLGFDSVRRMGITYCATNCEGCAAGNPPNSYGLNPPQSAVTMIVLPGDAGTSYVPAGSFTYYNNDFSNIGNPTIDTEFNNYMRAKLRDGEHFTNDFTGAGIPSIGYGSGPDCNYVFTGDPSDAGQWSECNCNNNPGNTRYILSSNDFSLNSGTSQKVVIALITTNPGAGGCPSTSFDSINIVADTAWGFYQNAVTAVHNVSVTNTVNSYPNPAHDKLFIENTGNNSGEESITIYNTLGQAVNVPISKNGQQSEADISGLPDGLYNILYRNGGMQTSVKFVKE